MTERRKITTLDKLKVMVRQAVCPLCGVKLGALADTQFDHAHPLACGGADDLDNLMAVHVDCHKVKTYGKGGTSYGSDRHEMDKARRLHKKREEAQRRLLAKDRGEQVKPSRWPKRTFRRAAEQ